MFGITITIVQIWLLNSLMAYSAFLGLTSGSFSFAYVAFVGVGGYAAALLSTEHGTMLWENLLIAPVITGAVALLIVKPLERLNGVYLAIASVALVGLFQVLLINFSDLTKGAVGISGVPLQVNTWILGGFVVVLAAVLRQIQHSDVGRAIRMTRLDPIVAVSLGVDVRRLRLWLFVASSALAGFAGVMRAHYSGYVGPDLYSFDLVITLLAMVIIGGIGSWSGPLIGAAIFTLLPEWLQLFGMWREFVTGLLLLAIVIVTREGLAGAARFGWYVLKRRQRGLALRRHGAPVLASGALDEQEHERPISGGVEG